jgi:hypothetical protein
MPTIVHVEWWTIGTAVVRGADVAAALDGALLVDCGADVLVTGLLDGAGVLDDVGVEIGLITGLSSFAAPDDEHPAAATATPASTVATNRARLTAVTGRFAGRSRTAGCRP